MRAQPQEQPQEQDQEQPQEQDHEHEHEPNRRPAPARRHRATRRLAAIAACSALALPAMASGAGAKSDAVPTVTPKVFATAPQGATKPDDITRLGDTLYVTYQNNAGKDGTPTGSFSTIVAFDVDSGKVLTTYTVLGRCDGLTADPAHGRLFASVNEDLNSSLFVITPEAATPVQHYTYSPSPAEGVPGSENGGTDAISISPGGTVYVAHSNPDPTVGNTAAVYTIKLDGSTAELTPVFGVNDVAKVIGATPPTSTALGLTDPDSNRFIPGPDGGTFVQDSQGDSKLVFARDLDASHPQLSQLNLLNAAIPSAGDATTTPQLDDVERVTGPGTLYAVDQGSGTIYAIDTANVDPGTWFVSQPKPSSGDLPNDPAIGVLDVRTGVVTHVDSTLVSPKGLLFVPSHRGNTD